MRRRKSKGCLVFDSANTRKLKLVNKFSVVSENSFFIHRKQHLCKQCFEKTYSIMNKQGFSLVFDSAKTRSTNLRK